MLLQDHHLREKIAHFDHERIPSGSCTRPSRRAPEPEQLVQMRKTTVSSAVARDSPSARSVRTILEVPHVCPRRHRPACRSVRRGGVGLARRPFPRTPGRR
nr:catalase [Streptomyces sp. JS01]